MSWSRKPRQVKSVCQFFIIPPLLSLCPLTVMFNFILHDKRKGPIWNIIMWTSLFLGQGVIICLYSQEWYAQRYCPLKEVLLIKITWCIFFPKMQRNSVIQSTQIQLLIVLFLFQPSFFELLKPRSWSCERPDDRLWWAVSYSWAAGTTIIADQYKWDQPVCSCHNFWTFVCFI